MLRQFFEGRSVSDVVYLFERKLTLSNTSLVKLGGVRTGMKFPAGWRVSAILYIPTCFKR